MLGCICYTSAASAMRDNICRKDSIKYNYVEKWMAWNLHHPGAVGETAIVIPGPEGVGENVFAEGYTDLWGSHGVVLDDEQSVTGKFNAILRKLNGKSRESERLVFCFDLLQRSTHPLKRWFDIVPARNALR
jgi:hypothetical protein